MKLLPLKSGNLVRFGHSLETHFDTLNIEVLCEGYVDFLLWNCLLWQIREGFKINDDRERFFSIFLIWKDF